MSCALARSFGSRRLLLFSFRARPASVSAFYVLASAARADARFFVVVFVLVFFSHRDSWVCFARYRE